MELSSQLIYIVRKKKTMGDSLIPLSSFIIKSSKGGDKSK